ncbi:MAG TPA: hypothetical protein VKQ34_00900 [Candidatus Saccharimonadales bacterium]|nr:hypothetical protein [Candidatus Saccharimonadales bacterium]
MRKSGRLTALLITAVTVFSSLWVGLVATPQSAWAATCQPPSIGFGRWKWCGYFYNWYEGSGGPVRNGGVPAGVQDAWSFINLILGDLGSGNTQRETAAKFIIRTMDGQPLPTPPYPRGTPATPYDQFDPMIADWENKIIGYASTGENGALSWGPSGTISWHVSQVIPCNVVNTYYQPTEDDVAPYIELPSNSNCGTAASISEFIYFRDPSGAVVYEIRRPCMNPFGTMNPLSAPPPQYNLTSNISITQGGTPLPNGSYVEAGLPIQFAYSVNNSMAGTAAGISCTAKSSNFVGYNNSNAAGGTPPGVSCTSTFGPGNTSLGTENIASAPANTSLCRSLTISPSTPSGGTSFVNDCVFVVSKPYMRTYGGDVSAGNPPCSAPGSVVNAAIVTWNKEGAGAFAGAGAQYAALAVDRIYDFSTALGNAGGAAKPDGLAFANTAAVSGGVFGGNAGTPSCIPDYYSRMPATTSALSSSNVSLLGTGTFTATGPITLSGNINPGQRTAIYVNGDVLITGNITFPGIWDVAHLPFFEIIAKGNIYVSSSVTQIDGLYVAQPNGAAGGVISTCAQPGLPATSYIGQLTNGVFNTPCNNQLTVNGAFVATQVQLLRTHGTLNNSVAGELNTSGNQAEVFNYSPALWMAMPPNQGTSDTYDSITSLPPIL